MSALPASADVGVIGAGIVGLATARALRQRGATVTIYERGVAGAGQSGGESRVFRHAHDDPRLVVAARDSRAIWDEWADELGIETVSSDGALTIGPDVDAKLALLRDVDGIGAHEVDPSDLAELLPLLGPFDGPAFLDPRGGSIRTTATIEVLVAELATNLVHDEVLQVRQTSAGRTEVRTGGRTVQHDHVVVCAGRGTPAIARSVGLELPVKQSTHVRCTFEPADRPPPRAACLQDSSGVFGETGIYAASGPDRATYAVGLSDTAGVRDDGTIIDATALADLADRAAKYVSRALPGLSAVPIGVRHCWVTELPWSSDGVAAWSRPGLTLVAGHNLFKLAPWLGGLLAASALGDGLDDRLRPESRLGAAPESNA
jgi:sarcosine oxidase